MSCGCLHRAVWSIWGAHVRATSLGPYGVYESSPGFDCIGFHQ